jgi:hypothetical protein
MFRTVSLDCLANYIQGRGTCVDIDQLGTATIGIYKILCLALPLLRVHLVQRVDYPGWLGMDGVVLVAPDMKRVPLKSGRLHDRHRDLSLSKMRVADSRYGGAS